MKLLSVLLVVSAFASVAQASEVPLPGNATDLIEAEDALPRSTHVVVDDQTASGGKAVASDKAWEPMFETDKLAGLTGRVSLWVRHRGGPVQLKTVVGNQQTDRTWSWGNSDEFEWKSLGTHDAAILGDRIRVIRGDSSRRVLVDAVAYRVATPATPSADTPQTAGEAGITGDAAGAADTLPPVHPDADAEAVTVPVSIDWDTPSHDLSRDLWGVNLFKIVSPVQAATPGYAEFLTDLAPSLVRVHSAEMTNRWWDKDNDRWNVEAIRRCFEPHREWLAAEGTQLMICLPYDWPASVRGETGNGKYLRPDRYEAGLANFRDLLRVLTEELDLPVTHWELTNEWDNTYERAGKLDELWTLVALLADAARDETPDVIVGGPALTWPKPLWIDGMLAKAGDKIEFVSYHGYAAGQPTTPNDAVMRRADAMAAHAKEVREALASRSLDMDVLVTEFNVQWTWQPFERRHGNSVGAAFLAQLVDAMAREGVDGATVWHCMGNAYGLIDDDARLRATGQVYLWANRHAHGTVVTHDADVPEGVFVSVTPVTLSNGGRTVMVANGSPVSVELDVEGDLLGRDGTFRRLDVTSTGARVAAADGLTVEGFSVAFFTDNADGEAAGTIDLPGQHVPFGF